MTRRGWLLLGLVGALGCGAAASVRQGGRSSSSGEPPRAFAPAAPVTSGSITARDYAFTKGALLPDNMRVPAAGFAHARGWLNTTRTPVPADFAGRVTVVDFWTSCCINCIQTLPTLARLESRHAHDPFLVVGVHTQKFDAEPEVSRLRATVIREGITHPVAIDGDRGVWEAWDVSAWPTVFVVDASGRVAWTAAGEPDEAELEAAVESALAEGKREGKLAQSAPTFLGRELDPAQPLAFPEKIATIADGFAVSDGGHDRVVLTDLAGKRREVIGDGVRGFVDGSFEVARFAHPQGLAELDGVLYVADEGNHAIRAIDRRSRTVTTVAGTGKIGHGALEGEVDAKRFALRSPWDLAVVEGTLYVALAGSHQIAALDPRHGKLKLVAGTSRENRVDGPLLYAAFAQPSGLATDGHRLFVLDSETSSVRSVDLGKGEVRTLVGKALFEWGDVDGPAERVRLQHPVGLAYGDGALFVADTYNGKVKRIDPNTGETHTVIGATALGEPAGLAFAGGGRLLVADTNHQRIVALASSGGAPTPWTIVGLTAPATASSK
jgi:DNA-binding beta-propeller fold protein YncE